MTRSVQPENSTKGRAVDSVVDGSDAIHETIHWLVEEAHLALTILSVAGLGKIVGLERSWR